MPETVTLSLATFKRVVRVINANAHVPFCKDVRVVRLLRNALIETGVIKRGEHAYYAVPDTGDDYEDANSAD